MRSLPPTLGGHSWCARGTYRNVLHKDTFSVFVEGTIFWVVETIVEERPRGRVYLPHKRTYMHRSLSLRGLYSVAERNKRPEQKYVFLFFISRGRFLRLVCFSSHSGRTVVNFGTEGLVSFSHRISAGRRTSRATGQLCVAGRPFAIAFLGLCRGGHWDFPRSTPLTLL